VNEVGLIFDFDKDHLSEKKSSKRNISEEMKKKMIKYSNSLKNINSRKLNIFF
jgi:hypothetical protein